MYMRLLLFCCICLSFCADAQNKTSAYPLQFVHFLSRNANGFDKQNPDFLFVGKLPAHSEVLRKLADTIAIIRVSDQATFSHFKQYGNLFSVNNAWKFPLNFFIPAEKNQKEKIQSWIIELENTYAFISSLNNDPLIQIESIADNQKTLQVKTSWRYIEKTVLNRKDVLFIDRVRVPYTERELTGFDLSANKGNLAHRLWPDINGKGFRLAVKENKMDTTDIDFKGRYISSPIASGLMETHATTMATIAAGAGNSFYTGKGMAWAAGITSTSFSNLLPDANTVLNNLQVTVQNHSYGTGIENYYGADAAAYDAQQNQQKTLLHIFSAGNLGTQTSSSGNYAGIQGFANLSGSFKMSKNSIAVGAMDSLGNTPLLSSRGPAYDGRVKPELVALGEDGTSGAAAIVSGTAILLQQAWQKQNGTIPTSDIVRAVLLNTADDTGPKNIDFVSGYGSVNAKSAIQNIIDGRIVVDSVNNQEEKIHRINIPANTKQLKVTLSWIDPAAQANTYKALINDLDLTVVHTTTSTSWLPWVLNAYTQKDSLQQLAIRKKDSLNNNEQVTIDLPVAGEYQLRIKAHQVATGKQPYAIAWQYDTLQHFQFSYPVKGDHLEPKRKNLIRWQTTITDTATLLYRLNNGIWQTLANAVDLSKNSYAWQPPDTMAVIQFRLQMPLRDWLSDTVTISMPLPINTGFNCVDSFLIYWQKANVSQYRVYTLGDQYLQPLITISDTALIQYKQNNTNRYFTVAPVLTNGAEAQKSYTFNYTTQQTGCYISSFIADPFGTNMARLTLQLGTTYQVAKIIVEKLTQNGYTAIQEITPVVNTQFTITASANNGLNIYRSKIVLSNGISYYTQPAQVIHFGNQPYYVFPNPVQPGRSIQVLTEDPDNKTFRLYDLFGRLQMKAALTGASNQLQMPLLQKGIYFYTITQTNQREITGKLIVQ